MISIYTLYERAARLAPTISPQNRTKYNELMEKLQSVKEEEDKRQRTYAYCELLLVMLEGMKGY